MKTQDEILSRIAEVKENGEDFFGATRGDLIDFLTFENAKPFLIDGMTEEEWSKSMKTADEESIKIAATSYLPFAWEKANNCRGLSASRSIDHMKAYAWMLGDEAYKGLEEIEYEHYGKEKLIYMSELVGFDWKSHDNGIRTNTDD